MIRLTKLHSGNDSEALYVSPSNIAATLTYCGETQVVLAADGLTYRVREAPEEVVFLRHAWSARHHMLTDNPDLQPDDIAFVGLDGNGDPTYFSAASLALG